MGTQFLYFYSCHKPNSGVVFEPQTGEVRHISHLNFIAWPDHDTPSQPDDLLTFISYMRHVHKAGPIITHCSAGIGRSGTLICIDVVLGLISRDLDVSIHGMGPVVLLTCRKCVPLNRCNLLKSVPCCWQYYVSLLVISTGESSNIPVALRLAQGTSAARPLEVYCKVIFYLLDFWHMAWEKWCCHDGFGNWWKGRVN